VAFFRVRDDRMMTNESIKVLPFIVRIQVFVSLASTNHFHLA
jgi:hypothetical protein